MHMDGKAEAGAESLQLHDAGAGAVAKMEVAALVQGANAQAINQDAAHKLPRRQGGQGRVKGQHQHRIDACGGQQADARVHGRQQAGRLGGAQELLRMRIEGHGHRPHAQGPRFGHHGRKNLLVAQVHAVEVADGHHRGAKPARDLSHRAVNGNHAGGAMAHRFTAPSSTGRVRPS